MGVKELWSILTPHAQRKPINELRGKKVAIDLAGWVCESLNVVDHFVHPRNHLKNLFFRTCYLVWEQVTPVFVLEGVAPNLKSQVIAKRNDIQFRGVRPKEKKVPQCTQKSATSDKGRSRFNHVLKQCENLLISMGIQCIQGPGEAEAYCAFLNKHALVDGVISQDSDCFGYGALRVYRNFSVSTQGTQAAAGGAVDIYDMEDIRTRMDFGQNKVIVMALLCGCDYCPDGIGGIGKDGVLKLFRMYNDSEILERIRNWRSETNTYNAKELRVDDKTICSNCGHIGRTLSHTKSGCCVCRTAKGCNESLWKEQRLSIKAELVLRKKALSDVNFPNEEIISEFLSEPSVLPKLNLDWQQPNLVKFIKQIGPLLQWPEIYCFQKFFPILTRWQLQHGYHKKCIVMPKEILKKRVVKGVASLELCWEDIQGSFNGLIPQEQIAEFCLEHPKGIEELFFTIEPLDMLQNAYPDVVNEFLKSMEKPIKKKVTRNKERKRSQLEQNTMQKFLKQNIETPNKLYARKMVEQCSTPVNKCLPSDLESDGEFDMSDIVNVIVSNPQSLPIVTNHAGYLLHYKMEPENLSMELSQLSLYDDNNLNLPKPDNQSNDIKSVLQRSGHHSLYAECIPQSKGQSTQEDSFDLLVKGVMPAHQIKTPLKRFKEQHRISAENGSTKNNLPPSSIPNCNVSFFFNQSCHEDDVFEQIMASSMVKPLQDRDIVINSDTGSD